MTSGLRQLKRRFMSNIMFYSATSTKMLNWNNSHHLTLPCGRRFWMEEMLVSILDTNKHWTDWIQTSRVSPPTHPRFTRLLPLLWKQCHRVLCLQLKSTLIAN